jgi:DNA-binding transcriptional regulator YhcF (GntR family)
MNPLANGIPAKPTARRRVVAALTQEILNNPETKDFPLASEHQLCRRFSMSRVTIRLALGDLEHRGLIYRRHGKGTFAHGCSTRSYRNLGMLIKSPEALRHSSIVEIIRGVQNVMASLRSAVVLFGISPMEWHPDMVSNLGGVIVIRQNVMPKELEVLKKHRLPFVVVEELRLMVMDDDFFNLGQCAAMTLNNAALTGERVECDHR